MGSSASKVAPKAAAAAARRQYPSTSSILNSATSISNAPSKTTNAPPQHTKAPAPSQVHPDVNQSPPTPTRTEHVDLDGRDPQFGASLRKLGPAIAVDRPLPSTTAASAFPTSAFPTSSNPPALQHAQNIFPSSDPSTNPSLMIVQTRERIAQTFESETENLGRGSFAGRTLVGAREISEAIRLRDETGMGSAEVEKRMRLRPGVLDLLGPRGMVGNAST